MKNVVLVWDGAVSDWSRGQPFSVERLNEEFAHFSSVAAENGVNLLQGYFEWYSNGEMGKCFGFDDGWKKRRNVEVDAVWDATEFENASEFKQKVSQQKPFVNSPEFGMICKDKLKTYDTLGEYMPETYKASYSKTEALINSEGRAVLKPVDDLGGEGVKIIDSIDEFENHSDYLVQEFIDSREGIPGTEIDGVHDLRAIIVDGEPVSGFVRRPDEGLISNVAQGGRIDVFPLEDFPEDARDLLDNVLEILEGYRPYFASVDMIYDSSSGNFKVIELNSAPSPSYYGREDMKAAKTEVVREIIQMFSRL